jgi:hypothetical protein
LIQLGLRHDIALKEAIKARKAEDEESKAALIELRGRSRYSGTGCSRRSKWKLICGSWRGSRTTSWS